MRSVEPLRGKTTKGETLRSQSRGLRFSRKASERKGRAEGITDLVQTRSMEFVGAGLASPVGERSIADADDPVESKQRRGEGEEEESVNAQGRRRRRGREPRRTNSTAFGRGTKEERVS